MSRAFNGIHIQPCGGDRLHERRQARGPQPPPDSTKHADYMHRESKYGCLGLSTANERLRTIQFGVTGSTKQDSVHDSKVRNTKCLQLKQAPRACRYYPRASEIRTQLCLLSYAIPGVPTHVRVSACLSLHLATNSDGGGLWRRVLVLREHGTIFWNQDLQGVEVVAICS